MATTKLIFFVLCHKNPQQVIKLVERLRDRDSIFVLHVDSRANREVYETVTSFSETCPAQVHLCRKRYRCYWGRFGIVKATLSCIREALELGLAFNHAFLISGQDYPIKSLADIRAFLDNHAGKEFIESFPVNERNRWTEAHGDYNAINRVRYWTISLRSRHIQIKWRRRFPFGFRPHCGSMWWCLTNECITYIDRFVRENRSYLRYFRTVFIPDESFFQSIVSNSPYRNNIISDDLRYVDWDHPNPGYPRTLETSDFEKLRASSKLIARKFDARSEELLSLVDREIIISESVNGISIPQKDTAPAKSDLA
ncbi:MAG TPA: beta-1,6-N-acetylglucosaminyltransferase [Chthoniobacterales bacterium]|nr:beta-1,6-N-acetylglucosaminyltransferase [Chthoniobacterales bacterium]